MVKIIVAVVLGVVTAGLIWYDDWTGVALLWGSFLVSSIYHGWRSRA